MNDFDDEHNENEQRQFNFPGLLWNMMLPGFPPGNQPQGPGFGGPGYPGWNNPGGSFPGGGGGGGGQQSGPPNTAPPSFTPTQSQVQTFAIDPGAIRGCLFRFTYVWLRRDSFWFFPTFIGRESVAGWRWRGNRWVYFGIDLDRIQSFQCF